MKTYRYTILRNDKMVGIGKAEGTSRLDAYLGLCLKHPEAEKIDRSNGRLILRWPDQQKEWEL